MRAMKKNIIFCLTAVLFTFSACKGDGETTPGDLTETDTLTVDTVMVDTLSVEAIDTVQVDSAGYIDEEAALTTQIEQQYGEQWDFCDCVVKNDSANNAIFETDDDAQLDLILARMEVIDQHCKEMLTSANTTPEERQKHERKVNKCLKAAKK